MEKTLYCPACKKEVNYHINKQNSFAEFADVEFEEEIAVCNECGEELYSDELMENNQRTIKKRYIIKNDIISDEEIEGMLKKYKISKRNLPLVLELGEQTITRYLDGYFPTKKISDYLRNISSNPSEYRNMLIKNKDKIVLSAYQKSKSRVDKLLEINDEDMFADDVAKYILSKDVEITNLMLQKLLYYSELFYMVFDDKTLLKSGCKAWDFGPVYGQIYYEYKNNGRDVIDKLEFNKELDKDLQRLIDIVIDAFACYSGKVLSFFTHQEDPWKLAIETEDKTITKESMLEYARKIKQKYGIKSYKDIYRYSKMRFTEFVLKR